MTTQKNSAKVVSTSTNHKKQVNKVFKERMNFMAGRYYYERYTNPNNFNEKIEVKVYGNGNFTYRHYIIDGWGNKIYKGTKNKEWRRTSRKSITEMTTTFWGNRWLKSENIKY